MADYPRIRWMPTWHEGGVAPMVPRMINRVLAALIVLIGMGWGRAQDAGGDINYSRHPMFRIPFQTDAGGRIKQIQLYVSYDKGATWHPVVTVAPDQKFFDFRAPQDGLYWFAVRTVDFENRAFPLTMDGVKPGLKVYVDTQPPVIRLRPAPGREGEIGVEWDVRDENLDPTSLRLEYRLPGSSDWIPLAADLQATGQRSWKPTTNGSVEVRLRARDKADNWGEEKTALTPGASIGTNPPFVESGVPRTKEAAVRLVNSKRFGLNYDIKEKGPSGVSAVELWFTQDPAGRIWSKYREEEAKDGNPPQSPFLVEVNGEGLYGFTMVVRSGVGLLGERPPQVGDSPQVWVEVDLTKPVVRLGAVDVGRGTEAGRLTIHWTATDKNMGKQPITLSYGEKADGPWKTIIANLENAGQYTWQMPADVPYKFLLRVEATDRAGNIGADETPKPIIVDLSQPKGVILNVDPINH
ncbi:MAG TPA: hypothetical protein VGY77_00925 [Gemmataceae bacterium]|nr:hypothetical protein [Gemmataceae bacterium]